MPLWLVPAAVADRRGPLRGGGVVSVLETPALDRLAVRTVIEMFDPGRALRIEAVDPVPVCGCPRPLSSRIVRGCLECGGRLRSGAPWMPRP